MKIQELNVYGVLTNKEKILVLKRKNGIWEFPGGGVEWGEHPEASFIRETKEETGMVPKNIKFLGLTSSTYKKEENEKHSIYLVYKAEVDSDIVTISGEHSEYRWLQPNEAKYLKLGLNAEPILNFL